MKPFFGDPVRLKRLARSDDDVVEALRGFWERTTGIVDERPFEKVPFPTVLLRYYRYCATRLRQLEQQKQRDYDDLQEMDRLAAVLSEDSDKPLSLLAQLEAGYNGKWSTSGDPLWDEYVRRVMENDIPESWWGNIPPERRGRSEAS